MKKILIINGPNLNLLGKREPVLYGNSDFTAVLNKLKSAYSNLEISHAQTNSETEMVEALHDTLEKGVEGIVLNPAAFTHTSLAVADAVAAIDIPVVEVHISNTSTRESFRQRSYVSKYAVGVIQGFGVESYRLAVDYFSGVDA